MAGQRRFLVKHQIGDGVKIIGRMAGRGDAFRPLHIGDYVFDGVGVNALSRFPAKAEDDGAVRAMADAGEGKRAVQASRDMGDFRAEGARPIAVENFIQKPVRRRHRPHCVGTRRTDADLEQVKYRKKHDNSK